MTEVVDLNQKRLMKTVREARDILAEGDKAVQLLECATCRNTGFLLTHEHQVVCSTCNIVIEPLRWFDVNVKPPAA